MTTLREAAKAYEPPKTLNVTDLPMIPVDAQVYDDQATDKDGKTFTYKFMDFNDKKYRVASTVLEEIQKMLKLRPELKTVKVTKTGSGKGTKYAVEMID